MKSLVVLLSLMIMFLNAVPCCWDACEEDTVEHAGENSGSKDACSPFLSCGSCAGFILQQELPELSSFNFPFRSKDEQEDSKFHSAYTTIIWAPPKQV